MDNYILFIFIAVLLGLIIGWFSNSFFGERSISEAKLKKKQIIEDAQSDIEDLKQEQLLKLKEEHSQTVQKLEQEFNERNQELKQLERDVNEQQSLNEKEQKVLNKAQDDLNYEKLAIENDKKRIQETKNHYKELIDSVNVKLEKIAGMSKDEAMEILKENLIAEAKKQTSKVIDNILDEARSSANREAKDIVLQAIHQTAADHSAESTVSIINLPDDTMKGRIIGREGRNIRSYEMATGCDVLIDDTPNMIVLSCFNPMRREIGKITLDRLVEDGRIHPGRIEEMVEKVTSEMDDLNFEAGEQALFELGLHDMPRELVALIGQMRFRSLSGQNLLKHSIEVAQISAMMAKEMDIDVYLAKRSAVLHEIGRVSDKTDLSVKEKTIETLRKYNENKQLIEIINSINEQQIKHKLAYVISAAKSISSLRPGARKDVYEKFVTRLQELEDLAVSFEGVIYANVIQAGREIRVMIDCDVVEDSETKVLANQIASKIEREMEYPGQIKVTVYREFRAFDLAK